MRVACVYIPHFCLQIECLRDPDLRQKTVVIVGMPEKKGFIMDCSEELTKRGVLPLTALKDAYHLCFDAIPVFASRKEYAVVWNKILSAVAGITLRMEQNVPGTVFLDITRLPGTYKSEEELAAAVIRLLYDQFGFYAKAGVGNSRFMALEAALSAPQDTLVIPTGAEKKFLSPLHIERLPVPDKVRERLHLLGLHTLGKIGAFTLSALTSQFGASGKVLWEISNGVEERDRIAHAFAVTDVDQEMVCDTEVYSKEQIKMVLMDLLEKLCLELEDLDKACRAIKLIFDLRNKTFFEKRFVFHIPTASKEEMLRRIMAGLEQVNLASPVQIISVRASSLVPYGGKQESLFRARSDISTSMKDIGGFLKTKYGSMPLAFVAGNDVNAFLPDERFIFVEP